MSNTVQPTTITTTSFLGLVLQNSVSELITEILASLGISLRESSHDDHNAHKVLEIDHGYLEFYMGNQSNSCMALAVESKDIDQSLSFLPKGYSLIYRGETELADYAQVIVCEYAQGLQVKIYESR